MLRRITLIVGAFALITFAAESQDTKKSDPLPDGAIVRLGSLRWRHGDVVTFVAFPDAKTVLTASQDNIVRVWDRETGKELRRLEMGTIVGGGIPAPVRAPFGGQVRVTLAPDGKTVAHLLPGNFLQLLSVATGKEIRRLQQTRINAVAAHVSPDGKVIALRAFDKTTFLLDAQTGKELHQIKGMQGMNGAAVLRFGGASSEATGAFSLDGTRIATALTETNMQKITHHVKVTEVATGKPIYQLDAPSTIAALTYSPDGNILAYAVDNTIFLRAAETGKEMLTFPAHGSVAAMAFSPDNKTLALRGRDQEIRLIHVASGKLTHRLGEPAVPAAPNFNGGFVIAGAGAGAEPRDFAFSPDSKVLAVGGQQALRFFNLETGKEQAGAFVQNENDGHKTSVTAVIAPDGKMALTRGADRTIRRWDLPTGKEVSQFTEPKGTNHVAFSPNGKHIALSNVDGTIRLFDNTGKELHSLRGHQNGASALAFSRDGKRLVSRGPFDAMIRLFDVEKGAELRHIDIAVPNRPEFGGVGFAMAAAGGRGLAFSADGQTIAGFVGGPSGNMRGGGGFGQPPVNVDNSLRLWDFATGKELRRFDLPLERSNVVNLAFSPDGRVLAAENADQTVSLWEITSGRERGVFGQPATGVPGMMQPIVVFGGMRGQPAPPPALSTTLVYSPDGSLLAARGANNTVRLWDVRANAELMTFTGHTGAVLSLAFTNDGRALATSSADTTVLVWDVAKIKRTPKIEAELTAKQLDTLWADLLGDDAIRAYKGIQSLAAAPQQAAPFLRDKVKPATPPDVKKINQWITDLDSPLFPKRSKAAEELEKLGELAVPALRKVLESTASLEFRRRVEPILEKATTGALGAEPLRTVRAIEALEKMGTTEARQTLETLAEGAAGALQTRQARESLERMPQQASQR